MSFAGVTKSVGKIQKSYDFDLIFSILKN